MWTTFNEAAVMGFCGWLYGAFPPAQVVQFYMAGLHLLNTYRAHAAVYKAIKALPGAPLEYSSLLFSVGLQPK